MAFLKNRGKDYAKAREVFRDALRKEKDIPVGLFGLAKARFSLIEYQQAKRLFERYQKKVSLQLESKNEIIRFVVIRYREFKKGFDMAKRLGLKRKRDMKVLRGIEKKIEVLERMFIDNNLMK